MALSKAKSSKKRNNYLKKPKNSVIKMFSKIKSKAFALFFYLITFVAFAGGAYSTDNYSLILDFLSVIFG